MTPLILIAVGVIGVAGLVFWPQIERWLNPVPKPVPGRDAAGADEKFPGELRALRYAPVAQNLIRPAEQMVADHEALSGISAALDNFDRIVSDAISRFLRSQPTVLLRLPSSIEVTGELPVVEMVGGK